jgi:hypothetical protein
MAAMRRLLPPSRTYDFKERVERNELIARLPHDSKSGSVSFTQMGAITAAFDAESAATAHGR